MVLDLPHALAADRRTSRRSPATSAALPRPCAWRISLSSLSRRVSPNSRIFSAKSSRAHLGLGAPALRCCRCPWTGSRASRRRRPRPTGASTETSWLTAAAPIPDHPLGEQDRNRTSRRTTSPSSDWGAHHHQAAHARHRGPFRRATCPRSPARAGRYHHSPMSRTTKPYRRYRARAGDATGGRARQAAGAERPRVGPCHRPGAPSAHPAAPGAAPAGAAGARAAPRAEARGPALVVPARGRARDVDRPDPAGAAGGVPRVGGLRLPGAEQRRRRGEREDHRSRPTRRSTSRPAGCSAPPPTPSSWAWTSARGRPAAGPTPSSSCAPTPTRGTSSTSRSRATGALTSPHYGTQKINAAFFFGGQAGMIRAVKRLTGLPINHLIVIKFAGFPKMVDASGA